MQRAEMAELGLQAKWQYVAILLDSLAPSGCCVYAACMQPWEVQVVLVQSLSLRSSNFLWVFLEFDRFRQLF